MEGILFEMFIYEFCEFVNCLKHHNSLLPFRVTSTMASEIGRVFTIIFEGHGKVITLRRGIS